MCHRPWLQFSLSFGFPAKKNIAVAAQSMARALQGRAHPLMKRSRKFANMRRPEKSMSA